MAFHHHVDSHLHASNNFRDFCGVDGQVSPELRFNSLENLHDQSQHPPYIPPFHVAGFAPGPIGDDVGKRIKEMDFMENNDSQMSSIDIWRGGRSVSTGLGLSIDDNAPRLASSFTDGSALMSLVGYDIDQELQRQDAETDRFLKIQGDQLRRSILDKIQKSQQRTVSLMEERAIDKLNEKDEELEMINRKNKELEARVEQLKMEAEAWQHHAMYNENVIAALNYDLERAHGRPRDSIVEGCGDSEVEDTASCFNGRNKKKKKTTMMMCRFCGVREVCMLLLPCKHMCLCKECESKLSSCPLCQSSKFIGMEVYM
ncbi:unnamed protein product [Cochlearia groenlandica]